MNIFSFFRQAHENTHALRERTQKRKKKNSIYSKTYDKTKYTISLRHELIASTLFSSFFDFILLSYLFYYYFLLLLLQSCNLKKVIRDTKRNPMYGLLSANSGEVIKTFPVRPLSFTFTSSGSSQ